MVKLDEIAEENQAKILQTIATYDKGEGVTWGILLEKSGLAKATLSKHIKRLIEKGVIDEAINRKDRRIKIYRINENYNTFVKKISEIRRYTELFDKYVIRTLAETVEKIGECETKEEFDKTQFIFERRITFCRRIILEELNQMRSDIIDSDISEKFKKDLLYETFKVEKEINEKWMKWLFDKDIIKRVNPFKVQTPSDFAILKQVKSDLEVLKEEIEVR